MPTPELASVDGSISPTAEATIALPDDGLYRGDGAFEVIRLYRGRPFELGAHLDRLERSAAAIALEVDRAAFERELPPLLERFGDADGALRVIATRGGRRLLLTEPLPERLPEISLATVTYSPTEILNGVKSLSYAANMHATRLAADKGADEALLVRPDGIVLEAPTSAIFWVGGGELRTPALECGILDSITRRHLVAELSPAEGEFELADLEAASEAFLASTTREVQPVAAIDQVALEVPGAQTQEAVAAFARAVAAELGD
jgi:branched-chain amino acid aminotransferase